MLDALYCHAGLTDPLLQIKKLSTYALQISDTVAITTDVAEVMTKMTKSLSDVSYLVNDKAGSDEEEDDDDDESSVDAPGAPAGDAALARKLAKERGGTRTSSRLAKDPSDLAEAQAGVAEREKKQIELMRRRNLQRVRELAKLDKNRDGADGRNRVEELMTYGRTSDYPDNVQPNQVKVDMVNQCVILPICGNPIPFHISTIKNIVMPEDDTATLLRINFYSAGQAVGKDAPVNMAKLVAKYAPYATFIRELTFRSLEGHNLTLVGPISQLRSLFLTLSSSRRSVKSLNYENEPDKSKCANNKRPRW
jgi:nucleosome binding factor SPN SPT16 subunit